MNVRVIGAGFVGIPTAVALDARGHNVALVDIDQRKVELLAAGVIPFHEPGLEEAFRASGVVPRRSVTGQFCQVDTDVTVLAVGTPTLDNGAQDTASLIAAARRWAEDAAAFAPNKQHLLVVKSTVLPGTCRKVQDVVRNYVHDAYVAHVPEFLMEGQALRGAMNPDKVVIGCDEGMPEPLRKVLSGVFAVRELAVWCDTTTAELCKYANNVMLASRLSTLQDLARYSTSCGANINSVLEALALDPRIGSKYLDVGGGWGGSCFPKDVSALIEHASRYRIKVPAIEGALQANAHAESWAASELLYARTSMDKSSIEVAVLGASFKPNTSDTRCSPAMHTLAKVTRMGGVRAIRVYDPAAGENVAHAFGDNRRVQVCSSMEDACTGADAVLLLTAWDEFLRPPMADVAKWLEPRAIVIDARRMWLDADPKQYGLHYVCIGHRRPKARVVRRSRAKGPR